jgi:Protein of unknown function (DUF4089)
MARGLRRTTEEGDMASEPFDAGAYVDAAAALVGLPIDPAHRPGIAANIERIAQMAALVMEFPLPDDTEPAPIYQP